MFKRQSKYFLSYFLFIFNHITIIKSIIITKIFNNQREDKWISCRNTAIKTNSQFSLRERTKNRGKGRKKKLILHSFFNLHHIKDLKTHQYILFNYLNSLWETINPRKQPNGHPHNLNPWIWRENPPLSAINQAPTHNSMKYNFCQRIIFTKS